jgi:hypothetical protein
VLETPKALKACTAMRTSAAVLAARWGLISGGRKKRNCKKPRSKFEGKERRVVSFVRHRSSAARIDFAERLSVDFGFSKVFS